MVRLAALCGRGGVGSEYAGVCLCLWRLGRLGLPASVCGGRMVACQRMNCQPAAGQHIETHLQKHTGKAHLQMQAHWVVSAGQTHINRGAGDCHSSEQEREGKAHCLPAPTANTTFSQFLRSPFLRLVCCQLSV